MLRNVLRAVFWTAVTAAFVPAGFSAAPDGAFARETRELIIATDAMAIAFGNFDAGYTIAERPELRVLRDPFSAKPHVLFYATKRVGGDVSDFAAIKLLKFGIA